MIKKLLGITNLELRLEDVEYELWGMKNPPLFKVGQKVNASWQGAKGTIIKRFVRNYSGISWVYEVEIKGIIYTIKEFGLKKVKR